MEDRLIERFFDLAQDLRLSDDHRIEAGGDAEKVAKTVPGGIHVEAWGEDVGRNARLVVDQKVLIASKPFVVSLTMAQTSTRLQVDKIKPSSMTGSDFSR